MVGLFTLDVEIAHMATGRGPGDGTRRLFVTVEGSVGDHAVAAARQHLDEIADRVRPAPRRASTWR